MAKSKADNIPIKTIESSIVDMETDHFPLLVLGIVDSKDSKKCPLISSKETDSVRPLANWNADVSCSLVIFFLLSLD
jgi:hypothetical protein